MYRSIDTQALALVGVVALTAACAGSRADDRKQAAAPAPAATATAAPAVPAAADPRRWIAGDLHVHVAPFDVREGASLDGVEVWNLPLALANLASRPGGKTGQERAFAAADALARRERRPIAIVGGSDSHSRRLLPTTWVLAAAATEPALLAALRTGATCVGGPEAGTLVARGDADPPDRWARIGESIAARDRVELRWLGGAALFVDGVHRGEHDGGWTHDHATGVHTYRIELGQPLRLRLRQPLSDTVAA